MTTLSNRYPALDGLRIVGALGVVTTHVGFHSGAAVNGPWAGILSRLDAGVALFFVISGFLLVGPHVQARIAGTPAPDTRRYLWHRALRILPPLWLAVLAVLLFMHDLPGVSLLGCLPTALLVQIYLPGASVLGLTQMWSLATEAAFYLALPLLARALTRGLRAPDAATWVRRAIVATLVLPLSSLAWIGWTATTGGGLRAVWLPAYLGWFGLGMALSVWHHGRRAGLVGAGLLDRLACSPGTLYAAAGAAYLLLSSPVAGPYALSEPDVFSALVKNAGYAVLAAALVLPAVAPQTCGSGLVAALGSRPARVLGDISYGVFCYHLVVLDLVRRATGLPTFEGGFLTLEALTVPASLVVAWLSHRYVERPIMRWGRRQERSGGDPRLEADNVTTSAASTPS